MVATNLHPQREVIVMQYLSVSEAARRLKARPRDISDLFYRRKLRDDLCPILAGRRLIPKDYLDMIALELARTGRPVETQNTQEHFQEG